MRVGVWSIIFDHKLAQLSTLWTLLTVNYALLYAPPLHRPPCCIENFGTLRTAVRHTYMNTRKLSSIKDRRPTEWRFELKPYP